MKRLSRTGAGIGVLSVFLVWGVIFTLRYRWDALPPAVKYMLAGAALVANVSSLGLWFLAFADWFSRRPRSVAWGLALIFLNWIAGWFYWSDGPGSR